VKFAKQVKFVPNGISEVASNACSYGTIYKDSHNFLPTAKNITFA
jgi:hypothetical protein